MQTTSPITEKSIFQVSVPAGIDNGQSIRIRGKGEPGERGGEYGDLLVEVQVSRHAIFQRQDMDIYSNAPLPFVTAALGGEVRISTVDGDVMYTVQPGTQTDTKVRLRGKGVPSIRNKQVRGDHYVTLVVQVPTKLNADQKSLLKEFEESFSDSYKRKEETSTPEPEEKKKKSWFKEKVEDIKEKLEDMIDDDKDK